MSFWSFKGQLMLLVTCYCISY